MINDILDFSKIDAGKLQLELEPFDVEEMLQHIIQLTEGKAIEKGLSLQMDLSPAVPRFVHGDALRLSQILINYLNNAVKFTEQGGIVIRVLALPQGTPAPLSGASCRLRFEVQDTGIGVDEGQGERLFKSFEQGDNSTTRKFGGTGLGLAISRQLANLMRGTVGVVSQTGAGSTFWFEVPLEVAPEPDYESIPSPDVDGALQALRGHRVLVVDDNDFNLDVARGLLQDAAVAVEVARNGAQAIQAMLQSAFDCVLMDVQMPVMDGLEATQRIRSTPALAATVVIAMTANAGQEDRSLCLAAGMNEVIVKPVDPDVLYVTLAKWLGAARVRASAGPGAASAVAATVAVHVPELSQFDTLTVWDEEALARIVGNNQAAHARLLGKYQSTARETVVDIGLCAEHGQWSNAADLAHKLKSSSRSVGAMRLGGLCEALERAGRLDNAPACLALAQWVAEAFAEVDARISA
jgi:CheY-like chemotaxis protein